MANYTFIKGGAEYLDLIRPLWDKLNELHSDIADSFSLRFRDLDWNKCKKELIDQSGEMLVDYVLDQPNNQVIGFCITRIYKNEDTTGEIDSLFVEEEYRKAGVGKQLLERAIQWLEERDIKKKRILVVAGNESLIEYYKQFGFQPLHIVLQRKEEKN